MLMGGPNSGKCCGTHLWKVPIIFPVYELQLEVVLVMESVQEDV